MSGVSYADARCVTAGHRRIGLGRAAQLWGLTALLFLFVYNVSFLAAPSVTTGRVTLLLALLLASRRLPAAVRDFLAESWILCVVLALVTLYAAAQYAFGGLIDDMQLSRLVNFGIYSVLGAIVFAVVFGRDADRFATGFAVATAIQAALIFYSYASPDYRSWLADILVQGGHIPLTDPVQAPGFTNSSGALLSLIQGLGVFAALFAARRARGARVWALCLLALVDLTSTIVVARTGLLYGLAFLTLFLLAGGWKVRVTLLVLAGAGAALALALGADLVAELERRDAEVERTLSRTAEIFTARTQDPSFRELAGQPVPPLTAETFFGTGLVADPIQGNASGNDSGYVQTYYALGLVVTVVFYGALAGMLMKYVFRSADKFLLGVLLLSMFAAEVKEPFIYKYIYPFFVISVIYMSGRNQELHRRMAGVPMRANSKSPDEA